MAPARFDASGRVIAPEPVRASVSSGAGTARSITIGGSSRTTELELNGATLSLGSNSVVAPSGVLVVTGRSSTLQVQHPAVLTNNGVVTILTLGLLEGELTNASVGSLDINDSSG